MNKFFLVTIEGRRWITDGLILHSTGVYKYDIAGMNFTNVLFDGVAGSGSSSIPTGSDDPYTYYWDEENKLLYIRIDASDITNNLNVVLYHVIAATNDKDRYERIDPLNQNSRVVLFEGRIKGRVGFSQTQENNLVGILTNSLTSISLINTDQNYNKFGTNRDSFKNSRIRVYKSENGVTTAYYTGFITRLGIGPNAVFSVADILKKLENILYTKDNYEESIVKSLTGDQYEQSSMPIYRLAGRNSPFRLKEAYSIFSFPERSLIPDSMPEAVCIDYNPTLAVNVNRTWSTGIIDNISGGEESYEILTFDSATYGPNFAITLDGDYKNFTMADTFMIDGKTSSKVKAYTNDGLIIEGVVTIPAVGVGDILKLHKISALVLVKDGAEYLLYYGTHYTVTTPVAGEPIEIVLEDDFETAIGVSDPLDPANDRIYYKMRNVAGLSSYGHGEQIKNLLLTEFTTGDLDLTSFSQADIDLDLNINYMVPPVNGGFQSKRAVLERMLSTSMGYLYINENFEIAYGNYTASDESDVVDTLDDIDLERNSISHEIDFEDVYESLTINNDDFGFNVTIRDEQSTYLHQGNKKATIDTYAEVITPDFLDLLEGHFKRITSFFTCPKIKSSTSVLSSRVNIGDKKKIESLKSLSYPNATVVATDDDILRQEVSLVSLSESPGNMFASVDGGEEQAI